MAGNFKNLSSQSIQGIKNEKTKETKIESKTNMQSISSEDFKGTGTEGVKSSVVRRETSTFLPVKEEPVKEVTQHKKKLAQNLFAGFDGQLQQQKKTHSFGQQKQFTKKSNLPKVAVPSQEIDLLGDQGQEDLMDALEMTPQKTAPPPPFSRHPIDLAQF